MDRSALGEQAANAFGDTRMESLQTFADTFGVMSIDETTPDSATAVQVATIQGMVRRILLAEEGQTVPAVDQYDCIIVDECHRGYLLDRELSSTELGFRDFADYISKYRRVLDYFDAVKIGLTATPAPHTTDIFGLPVFTYSYREAVVDGYLVDYEPPFQIKTELNEGGIHFATGEQVQVYNTRTNQIELFKTPDQIDLEIESFNKRVITEPFNKAVCEYLARELDPNSPQKTLIFCATTDHADMVVTLLKAAFASRYGEVSDDAVVKITGNADKPLELIRRYKNERNPNVAVTVDLLTTGIDVPDICNLVFLRRVNSRILYEQMLGRATRLSPDIGKETFRVFDAVQLYEGLRRVSDMKPVVVNPNATFAQLADELRDVRSDDARELARDEFIIKLRRKKRHLSERAEQDFETKAGMSPDDFIHTLHTMPLSEIATWFTQHNDFAEILDRRGDGAPPVVYISQHADSVTGVQRGYSRDGKAERPEDYLQAFGEFVRNAGDQLPALLLVTTRPRELTRKDLRNLAMALDRAGFGETRLATAWREAKNEDIVAGIIGFIRQAALGERLIPYEQRVERALHKMLAARAWSNPQREWLRKIAAQTKVETIVDREALDDPNQLFQRDGGGFERLNRIFDGQLAGLLAQFNDEIWAR